MRETLLLEDEPLEVAFVCLPLKNVVFLFRPPPVRRLAMRATDRLPSRDKKLGAVFEAASELLSPAWLLLVFFDEQLFSL